MIGKLTGTIDTLKPTELILDVQGVGYQLSIPFTAYEQIKDKKEITLFVYTLHREDQLRLFGFHNEADKDLFVILLSVSGIGPSIALSILSSISPGRLKEAVVMENPGLLMGIPGIGKTKAEKIVFELKRKQKTLDAIKDDRNMEQVAYRDAVDALVSLGYDESRATKTVGAIVKENAEKSLETIIKEALRILSS